MMRKSRLAMGGVVGGVVIAFVGATIATAAPPEPTAEQVIAKAQQRAPRHAGRQAKDLKVKVDSAKAATLTLVPGANVVVAPEDAPNSVTQQKPDGVQVMTVVRRGDRASFRLGLPAGLQLARQDDGGYNVVADGPEGPVTVLSVDAPWAIDANGKQLPTTFTLRGRQLVQTFDTKGATYPVTLDPYFARKWYGAQVQFTWNETRAAATGAGAVAVIALAIPDGTISKIVSIAAGAVAWWAGSATLYNNCIALNVYWTGGVSPWYWHCPH